MLTLWLIETLTFCKKKYYISIESRSGYYKHHISTLPVYICSRNMRMGIVCELHMLQSSTKQFHLKKCTFEKKTILI